jgi:hypothetical protein
LNQFAIEESSGLLGVHLGRERVDLILSTGSSAGEFDRLEFRGQVEAIVGLM